MKLDMLGQPITKGDYVCYANFSHMRVAKVEKITDHGVNVRDVLGEFQCSQKHVFVCTTQIESVPELMV